MGAQLSLSLLEIIVLMGGAIFLGITIHFFIVSRRSLNASIDETPGGRMRREFTDWKLKYFNDIEQRDKEISQLKIRFAEIEENSTINAIEAEELRARNKQLQAEIEPLRNARAAGDNPDYIDHLRKAQVSLAEHNEKINQLLEKIEQVKEAETKQQEMRSAQEELSGQVDDLKFQLQQKEEEVSSIRRKEHMTAEMTSLVDSAYQEFNVLQEKIRQLESQLMGAKKTSLDYEELKESYYKTSRDLEEQKLKNNVLVSENRQLQADLSETEEKLIEANFQRQQAQKKVTYLEELNRDMQVLTEAQKKLEGQMKRIGELESMLQMVSEERNELANRKS
jgi:chromosome segregation ATPase